jgi:anti-sigma regulatory factor (Ser/Thr protein kinase)
VPARREVVGDLRREVVAFARGTGADEDTCQRVALAVAEAINNAVIHAYLNTDVGPVAVEAWSDRDTHLHVRVCDEGAGMVPRPDSPGSAWGCP